MAEADVIEEFIKSYNGAYFGLRIDGKVYPAMLSQERRADRAGVLALSYFPTKEGKSKKSYDLDWISGRDNLVRGFPDLGNLKIGQTYAYVSVRPQRQWKKGYVPENVELYIPNIQQIQKVWPRYYVSSTSRGLIWQIYNREFWHPKAAIEALEKGENLGYPLSQHFGVYITDNNVSPIITHKKVDIGVYSENKFQLFPAYGVYVEQFKRETTEECVVCR